MTSDPSAPSPDHDAPLAGHTYDGIVELDNPLPLWWFWAFVITVVFSIFYWLWQHSLPSDENSWDIYAGEQSQYLAEMAKRAVNPEAVVTASQDAAKVALGQKIYAERCASCHAPGGEGLVGPNLTDNVWIHGGDVVSIYTTVADGYPNLGMPEWKTVLEDEQLVDVVAFVLSLRHTNKAGKAPQGTPDTDELQLRAAN